MDKKEGWINPQVIDFKLSRWEKEGETTFIGNINGLYFGCVIKTPDITYIDIAMTILEMKISDKMRSVGLSKKKCKIKDREVTFYLSLRRVEVSYGLPRCIDSDPLYNKM